MEWYMQRLGLLVLALPLLIPIPCLTQDTPQVLYSVPLPGELTYGTEYPHWQWEPGMVRCGSGGDITVVRTSHHELLKVGPNGAVVLRIEVSGLAGLGDARVNSFAPGPNGETYVLASHVTVIELKRADPTKPPRRTEKTWDLRPTLLRFDANGALIDGKRLGRAYQVPWFDVFDSGDFIVLDGAWGKNPTAWIYSADGIPMKPIDLTTSALGGHSSDGPSEVFVFASGDKAFLFAQWYEPTDKVRAAVATVSRDGEVVSSEVVKLPKGYSLRDPRRQGEHLFGSLQIQADGDPKLGEPYVEVDPQSGDLRKYETEPNRNFPACDTPEGMSFFNLASQTLEVIQLKAQSNP